MTISTEVGVKQKGGRLIRSEAKGKELRELHKNKLVPRTPAGVHHQLGVHQVRNPGHLLSVTADKCYICTFKTQLA